MEPLPEPPEELPAGAREFLVVGLGASAGGLKALERFFDALPDRPGMAFVVVQHLDPTHASSLAELLQSHTAMPVEQVEPGAEVRPDRVYVIPPGKHLSVEGGHLRLSEPDRPRGQRAPIDAFFQSLASDLGERAAVVVLSGTGADGSVGLRNVKEVGGAVFAQSPAEAEYDGMPRSAAATGLVDVVATAAEIARALVEYQETGERIVSDGFDEDRLGADDGADTDALFRILAQMRSQTGHDFTRYKRATVRRRVERRMRVVGVTTTSAYLDALRRDGREAQALMRDLLISVTNFFRDEAPFRVLASEVVPTLFEGKGDDDTVRVWIPGCATGEEAYSIAILLCEHLDSLDVSPRLQVFATDLDADALDVARRGLYADVAVADVSPERLRRFFKREGAGYRIRKPLQDIVLFAQHNLLTDPPFSRLDLVSCRNLLIYLQREVQREVFQLFHYALLDQGALFLGSSETVDAARDLFRAIDKKARVYRRRSVPSRLVMATPKPDGETEPAPPPRNRTPIGDIHRDVMLDAYAPPSVIVDETHAVRYLFGDVGRYVRPSEGEPTHDVLQLVPRAVRPELRTALFQALKRGESAAPRRVQFLLEGRPEAVDLVVRPVDRHGVDKRLALVVFEPVPVPAVPPPPAAHGEEDPAEYLEQELTRTRHRLETVVEEYETSNEELQASNEELQSMNEELRSTTEELETSKEELQSTNEELQTVNSELKARVNDLDRANGDLENLMGATQIAILFLDRDLRLKRYTPAATRLFHIIPTDLGRPFDHVSHKIDHDGLPATAARVLETLKAAEEELRSLDGNWFVMRALPYRTVDDRIDGVVLTFVDVSDQKAIQEDERERAKYRDAVADLRERALSGTAPADLMDLAVRSVAQALDVQLAKVLELQPENGRLLLRAGVGWRDGLVGEATVPSDRGSQAGYTLESGGPVLVQDLARERRFSGPDLLTNHGVVSGVSVVVQGSEEPYGVFGAHSPHARTFTEREARFVQSVADVLGAAVERHRADAAIRESETHLRAVLDALFAFVAVLAPDGTLLQVNEPVLEASNVRPEEIYGQKFWDGYWWTHDDAVRDRVREACQQAARGEMSRFDVVARISEAGRLPVDFVVSPLTNADGVVTYLIPSAVDISARVEVEGALRESERMARERLGELEATYDTAPIGLCVLDADLRFVRINERLAAMNGRPVEAHIGRTIRQVVPGVSDDAEPILRGVLETGEPVVGVELTGETDASPGESRVWVESWYPLRDGDGNVTGINVVAEDVTERRRDQEALRRLNETLEVQVEDRTHALREKERRVRSLARSLTLAEQDERNRIAHVIHDDLQQLLVGADMQAHMLQTSLGTGEAPDGSNLLEGVTRVATIIGQAIAVARTLTVDLSPPILRSEGLVEAVQWVASRFKDIHDFDVHVEAVGSIPQLDTGVHALLFQTVRELLLNAVKHSGVRSATVRLWSEEGRAHVLVADEGRGFDPDALSSPDRPMDGFGLPSIRDRLALVGGRLGIEAAEGAGARFTIIAPDLNPPEAP